MFKHSRTLTTLSTLLTSARRATKDNGLDPSFHKCALIIVGTMEKDKMVCEHLRALERQIQAAGIRETSRGQAWSQTCREWVYFDCYFNRGAIRARLHLADCVKDHSHLGTHDGQESGFYCEKCKDGIMGYHENSRDKAKIEFK